MFSQVEEVIYINDPREGELGLQVLPSSTYFKISPKLLEERVPRLRGSASEREQRRRRSLPAARMATRSRSAQQTGGLVQFDYRRLIPHYISHRVNWSYLGRH